MLTKELIENFDKSNMFDEIKNMYKQIQSSIKIIDNFDISSIKLNKSISSNKYDSMLVCGMGGSAIGGDFVKAVISKEVKVPIYINRDYNLPSWVNKKTLVFICSYSGNTEETISSYKQIIKLNFTPIVISTGGYLLEDAIKNNFLTIKMPKGIQPRAAFGYSSALLLLSLVKMNILKSDYLNQLENSIKALKKISYNLSDFTKDNLAVKLAYQIKDKLPIIYGTPLTNIVSLRFRGQLAENSKILSFHNVYPELNHNEIEGFIKLNSDFILISIKDLNDNKPILKRMKYTSDILSNIKEKFEYEEKGDNYLERLYKSITFFDWVSFYLSILNEVDPSPVNNIMKLKNAMSK